MGVISNGTTLIDNGALDPAVPSGSLILLSTQTASSSASLSFTSGIDSTYSSYVFKFINIHPEIDRDEFQFNLSTDGGSNYNVVKTTTFFYAFHAEDGTFATLTYASGNDLAQSSSDQLIGHNIDNDNDSNLSGTLTLFNPSSTTYVKHFFGVSNYMYDANTSNPYIAGYGNTTSAVNAIIFKFAGGNIDAGTIKMYGVA